MREILNERYLEIHKERAPTMEYQAFYRVAKEDLQLIDSTLDMKVKIAYFYQEELLIVQYMPSAFHETASRAFYGNVQIKIASMGLNALTDYLPRGSTRYYGTRSSKEADEAWAPLPARRGIDDWPTIVLECGYSESLAQLRQDARWWLIESGGEVNIAVVISLNRTTSSMVTEKWEMALPHHQGPLTTAAAARSREPQCIQEVHATPTSVVGGPLVLSFEKIFLRPANPPEQDVVFTDQDFMRTATGLFTP
jgi:hypothetical protein